MEKTNMHCLVLVQNYPSVADLYQQMYVHIRLKEFVKHGHEISVISFATKNDYTFEGISVFTEKNIKDISVFDVIILHAPNLRNHLRFISKNYLSIKKLVFVIHGHEVLEKSKYYPKPYKFLRGKFFIFKLLLNFFYDKFKLFIFQKMILKLLKDKKLKIIFVSQWMQDVFFENIKIPKESIKANSIIIHNPVGKNFLEKNYTLNPNKIKADFITIRPFDNSKYAIDLVLEIARQNTENTFHIFGKGNFFKFYNKPANVLVFDKFIANDEIPEILCDYKCAIMLTRLDSQGVMMCEMAEFGMPLVVSEIPVCREMLKEFDNVDFVDNKNIVFDAPNFLKSIKIDNSTKLRKFDPKDTIEKEIKFIKMVSDYKNI
jgi:glycosyltransferase involved in cell wall biosynthesis